MFLLLLLLFDFYLCINGWDLSIEKLKFVELSVWWSRKEKWNRVKWKCGILFFKLGLVECTWVSRCSSYFFFQSHFMGLEYIAIFLPDFFLLIGYSWFLIADVFLDIAKNWVDTTIMVVGTPKILRLWPKLWLQTVFLKPLGYWCCNFF